jgi:hypothetical protein
MGIKNAEFDTDSESFKKVAKKFLQKNIGNKVGIVLFHIYHCMQKSSLGPITFFW